MAEQAVRDVLEERSTPGLRAVLYDADGSDREVDPGDVTTSRLADGQLLWIDIPRDDDTGLAGTAARLGVDERSIRWIRGDRERPRLERFDDYFHISIHAVKEAKDRFEPVEVHCLVGGNWVVTAHAGEFDLLGAFNESIKGETNLGRLDGTSFLANLLDWVLSGYFHVLENVEASVDYLDERLLKEDVDQDELLRDLVRLRRRITALRGMLAPHRDVATVLTQPGFAETSEEAGDNFRRLYGRLESAIDALETAREMVVGSFEVYMTQTAQRTNDVMRILTLVSVLLLPAAVLAGIMGMNFRVGLFNDADLFWVTLGVMAALAVSTLVVARRKGWI